jgi:hypothetical protein
MDVTQVVANVAKGAQRLDDYYNSIRWVERVNTEALNMSDCAFCILGQLFDDYVYGSDALELEFGEDYGFDFASWNASEEGWALLEIAWIEEINKRVAQLI